MFVGSAIVDGVEVGRHAYPDSAFEVLMQWVRLVAVAADEPVTFRLDFTTTAPSRKQPSEETS